MLSKNTRLTRWLCLAASLSLASLAQNAVAASTSVVISQIYGGGGNTGAPYKNDFIEIHNISSTPVSVSGWSVQYASATGTSWQVTPLTATTIPAGGYYLVQEAGGTVGASLPTADATGSINLSGTTGKVALVSSTTALSGTLTLPATGIVDFVGYGSANLYEGTGAAPTLSNTTSGQRLDSGTTDTDNNKTDFTAATPNPRNSATTPYPVFTITPSQVSVETGATGAGFAVSSQTIAAGNAFTSYAVTRSSTGVFVANSTATWSLQAKTGGIADSDLVASADGKSATFTAHAAGTATIRATVSGLTSVDSGVITVVPLTQVRVETAPNAGGVSVGTQSMGIGKSITVYSNTCSDNGVFGSNAAASWTLTSISGGVVSSDLVVAADGKSATFTPHAAGSAVIHASISGLTSVDSGTLTAKTPGAFTVLHMNDTHARVTPHKWIIPQHDTNLNPSFEDVGGAAYLAGEILSLTNANPEALVLDGGDISEGNPIGDMNGNGTMTQFYTLLSQKLKAQRGRGLDAVVVGNHDVRDASYIANLAALAASGVPVLSVNICNKGTQTPYFAASTIVFVNGVKVGILGYTTQESEVGASLSSTLDVVNCDWTSTDSTKIHLAAKVKDLRDNQGCDVVILLAHIGHSSLVDPTAPLLADDGTTKLPEIAVTGHWHTWTETVWQPEMLNYKTIFTESCSYMKYLGELNVNSSGKYLSSVQHVIRDSAITPDADVQALIAGFKATYDATHAIHTDDIVGYTANDLLLDNKMKWWSADEYPWSGNNTAGQWICDAMQWKGAQLWGSCDLSIEAGGGVRSDIPAGPVTFMQVYETFPWNDDTFCLVKMTGQEIINFLKATNCDAGFSSALDVTAYDGIPTSVKFNGSAINLTQTYTVCINNYMYAHPPSGWTWSDTNPQYRNDVLCRDGIVEYMQKQHGTAATAYSSGSDRYHLNTEFAGGFRAVVTMMNDSDTKTSYDDAFVRFLSATPETLARRGTNQVPADLVNADGSVNPANRLAEAEVYRSYMGFKPGALKSGDIIETWGKGSFYGGDPEFVDQEGIYADGVEFKVVGHDDSLAKPTDMPSIASFWNDTYKNHYVKFVAKKTGTSTVADQYGQAITVWDVTAYAAKTLPGNVGDILVLTGIPTMESYSLRFRCDSAVLGSTAGVTALPAISTVLSHLNPLPASTTASSLTLGATASANSSNTFTFAPTADAQVESGSTSYNGGSATNLYIQSSTSSYGNERAWLKFDLSSLPAGSTVSGASLQLYCWKATGAALPTEVHGSSDDSWTETGITWSNQPAFDTTALDTKTLASGTTNVWYSWDVTSFAQSQLSGDKTVSLLVKAATEGSTDTTAPAYGFDSKEYGSNTPVLQVTLASSGTAVTLASVQFYYRYSADNSTWGAWTAAGSTTVSPYTVSFNFPQGYGYYEFYSQATDSAGTVEPAPAAAQASTHYTATPPYNTEAIVSLGNLSATYDGNPHAATATTLPGGLNVTLSYNGSATPPTSGGTYTVVASVNQAGYTGSATGSLYIARINQSITFGALAAKAVGDAPFDLTATASSGLPVSFTSSDPSVATVSGSTVTIHGPGTVVITADQDGNSNYYGAPSVSQTLVVSGAAASDGDIPAAPTWALAALGGGLLVLASLALKRKSA